MPKRCDDPGVQETVRLTCGCGGRLTIEVDWISDNEAIVLRWLDIHAACVPGDVDTIDDEPSPDLDKRAELIDPPELSELFPEYVPDPEADDPEYNIPDGTGELVFKTFGFGFNPIFFVRKKQS